MKSTQTAETGGGNAPRADLVCRNVPTTEVERYNALASPSADESCNAHRKGEQCIYCGKDSWTCEHFDPREEALNNQ